jgi:error-prone DNA polymerase
MPEPVYPPKVRPHTIPFRGGAESPPRPSREGMPRPAPVELHCKTNYSFLEGASHPDELVHTAVELGYAALAITDRNSLAGVVRAHAAAKGAPLRLIIGAEIIPEDAPSVVLWATDRRGYGRLARLITVGRRRAEKGACSIRFDDIAAHAEGLWAGVLPGCGPVLSHESLGQYREVFGERLSLLLEFPREGDDRARLLRGRELSRATGVPLAAANDVHYHVPARQPLHDCLVALRHNTSVAQAAREGWLFANSRRSLLPADEWERLFAEVPAALARSRAIAEQCRFSLDELRYEYPEELAPAGRSPFEFLCELTWRGARERWRGAAAARNFMNPRPLETGDVDPAERLPVAPPDVRRRVPSKIVALLEHELRLIAELHYEAYFLTVWDLVRFARERRILCQGRGSAANSAVCYCLGVTSVDPDRIDVLFERFISRERNEAPDIDIDFEHERREEVLAYIYEKYGRERTGMTAEVITYRSRSAARDIGKALGLEPSLIDRIAKNLDGAGPEEKVAEGCRAAGLDPASPPGRALSTLCGELAGFPRHLSQHTGGMVMTRGPLCELVPIENAAMAGRTVIEWDKDDLDVLGILKVDCLSLGMLTAVRKAFELINGWRERFASRATPSPPLMLCRSEKQELSSSPVVRTAGQASSGTPAEERGPGRSASPSPQPSTPQRGRVLSGRVECGGEGAMHSPPRLECLADIPAEDPAVYDMICRADTMGVFQIESRAQMSMLPRLKPRRFYDLVIEVAIVRPGPIQGDMVHPYLRRRAGLEKVEYPNEEVRRVLEKTLGVPIFQEQAMRLAVVAAGFTPGEADQLRRAMGAWRKTGVIEMFRQKLVKGMLDNGHTAEFAERVFQQISGFGEYGFPESHSASFALIVYASAWLKRYHPAAFTAALINSQPMGFYAPAQLIRRFRELGGTVLPIDVNHSERDCTLEGDDPRRPALRLGFRLVRGLGEAEVEALVTARRTGGPFTSVDDLGRRAGLSAPVLSRLATADAFSSLKLTRRPALWDALPSRPRQLHLFQESDPREAPAPLPKMSGWDEVLHDYSTAGLSLRGHPVSFLRTDLDQRRVTKARDLNNTAHGRYVRVAGLVLMKQRPSTARGIIFITLEDETGVANLIVRPNIWDLYRQQARNAVGLIAYGSLERQGEVIHLMTHRLEDLTEMLQRVDSRSRDFK